MNLHRFYCEQISQPVAELSGAEARHLAQVLRLKAGGKVELFDGKGTVAAAVIKNTSSKKMTLEVEDLKVFEKLTAQIILAASVAKGERFDWLIEKCTELGVDRIVPVLFERTVKQPKNPKIVTRWNNIAISAAKQCRRAFLPQIDKSMELPEAVEVLKKDYPKGRFVVGSLSMDAAELISQSFGTNSVIAFVGPEGGLTEREGRLLQKYGVQAIRLTDTVLRIETAAVAFASVLAAQRENERQK